jgi:hypothetical protein
VKPRHFLVSIFAIIAAAGIMAASPQANLTVTVTASPAPTPSSLISLTDPNGTMPIPVGNNISYQIVESGYSGSYSIYSNSSTGVVYAATSGSTLGLVGQGAGTALVVVADTNGHQSNPLTVTVGSGSTPSPTPTGSATATPSPGPTSSGSGISASYSSLAGTTPPGGTYPYYPSSPFHVALPSNPVPVPAATSSRWDSDQSPDQVNEITVSEDGSNTNDGSDPTYYTDGDGTATTLICALNSAGSVGKYYCDNSLSTYDNSIVEFWNNSGNCPDSNYGGTNYGCPVGVSFGIPANMLTAGDTDHHGIIIKTTESTGGHTGYEVDFWGDGSLSTRSVPTSGNWTVAALGACSLNGDGTACSDSYAANMAGSLGLVRGEDIMYCLTGAGASNSSCVLPYALRIALKCNGTNSTYPASASDGQCGAGGTTGNSNGDSARVPEGTRGYINETDAQVNAESIADFQKVIRRTMDKQHYGFFDGDSSYGGAPGISLQYQGAQAYVTNGHTDPWKTLYNYEIGEGNSGDTSTGNSGKDMSFLMGMSMSNVLWCANSHNDGLCD